LSRPRSSNPAEPHGVGANPEHLVLGAGRLRTGPAGEEVDLAPGDYVTFPGDVPHHYEALETSWAVLVMEHR
jgi:quercetin dioxygenase-like cupin family protein